MVPPQSARAVVLALLLAAPARAQLQAEARAELVQATETRAELGIGATARVGTYIRAGLSVARDVWRSVDTVAAATRVEYLMRFSMDPLAEQRWGASFGGGLGYRERVYLLAIAELEGPRKAGMRPAFQFTLGAGARVALVMRRVARGRR